MIANIKKQQQLQQQLLEKKQQFNQPNSPLNAIRGMNLQQLLQTGGIPNTPIITPPGSSGKSLTKADLGILSDAKHAQQMAEYKEKEMKMKLEEEKKRYEAVNDANLNILQNITTMDVNKAVAKIDAAALTPAQRKTLSDIQADYEAKKSKIAILEAEQKRLADNYKAAYKTNKDGTYSANSLVKQLAVKEARILQIQDNIQKLKELEEVEDEKLRLMASIEGEKEFKAKMAEERNKRAEELRKEINTLEKNKKMTENEQKLLAEKRQELNNVMNDKYNPELTKLNNELKKQQEELANLQKANFEAHMIQKENEATIKGIKATSDRIEELRLDTQATKRENDLTNKTINAYKDLKLEDQYNTAIKLNILNKKLAKDTALKIAKQEALQNEINKMEIENEKLALEKAAYGTVDDAELKKRLEEKYRENAKEKEIFESTKAANKSMHERMRLQNDYHAKINKYNDDKITEAHNDVANEEKQLNDIKAKIDRQNEIKKTIETVAKARETTLKKLNEKKEQLAQSKQSINKMCDEIFTSPLGEVYERAEYNNVPDDAHIAQKWQVGKYAVKFEGDNDWKLLTKEAIQGLPKEKKEKPFKMIAFTSDDTPYSKMKMEEYGKSLKNMLNTQKAMENFNQEFDEVKRKAGESITIKNIHETQELFANMQQTTANAIKNYGKAMGNLVHHINPNGTFTINQKPNPENINMILPYHMLTNVPEGQMKNALDDSNGLEYLSAQYNLENTVNIPSQYIDSVNNDENKPFMEGTTISDLLQNEMI